MQNRVPLCLLLLRAVLGYTHFPYKGRPLVMLCLVMRDLGAFSAYILAPFCFCCFTKMLPGSLGAEGKALLLSPRSL